MGKFSVFSSAFGFVGIFYVEEARDPSEGYRHWAFRG